MNKQEFDSYIEMKNSLGSVPGLDNIKELMRRLGNPEQKMPVLHIAGTNGKGSIFAYVENVLMEAGLVAGRFISPAIFELNEMIQVNKEYISDDDFCLVMEKVKQAATGMEEELNMYPTAFELETAAAFYYFEMKKVDIALVECGMGGRLDATNLDYKKVINVLASISFDHMSFLGDTLYKIAREKLGICKKQDIVVSYPQNKEVESAKSEYSKENELTSFDAALEELEITKESIYGSEFVYKGVPYMIRMSSDYQVLNAITAIETINALNSVASEFGIKNISDKEIKMGLKNTVWPGRFTVVSENPAFIVDGAHNEDAWRLLAQNLNKYFTNKSIVYIIGVLKDKEYDKMLEYLAPTMKCAFTLTPPNPKRALDKDELKKLIEAAGVHAEACETVEMAIKKAEEIAGEDGVVLSCGTLSFAGEVLRKKGYKV